MSLKDFKKQFDPHLDAVLKARIDRALIGREDLSFAHLWQHVSQLAATGKRLRAYMTYLGYISSGGTDLEELYRVACGMELFHLFCLVHDDVMDQDTERRGVPTIHEAARRSLPEGMSQDAKTRVGDSIGILAGDSVFLWAAELLRDPRITDAVSEMADEVILGQALDVALATKDTASRDDLDRMIRMKTVGYSFVRPLGIGGLLAGHDDMRSFFTEFGNALGFAFQLQDDYFDREKDIEYNRPTYYTRGYEKEGVVLSAELFDSAVKVVHASGMTDVSKKPFLELVEMIRTRTS